MKKLLYLIMVIVSTACTTITYDINGSHEKISEFGWLLIIFTGSAILVTILYYSAGGPEANRKLKVKRLKEYGTNSLTEIKNIGKYVGGHPHMDNLIEFCSCYKKDYEIVFCQRKNKYEEYPKPVMQIPINSISNVILEDSSTMDQRVTLGRVLLIGIFALAWRKNKTNEMAFVVIEWTEGRFSHSTLFAYEGVGAMQRANSDRNMLLKMIE